VLQVELVWPGAVLFSGEGSQVGARTVDGDIGFRDHHAACSGALDIGQTQLWASDGVVTLALNRGFVEVSNNVVTILSDAAYAADEIDVAAAQADLEAARAAVAADADDDDAKAAVAWAETRIAVASAA